MNFQQLKQRVKGGAIQQGLCCYGKKVFGRIYVHRKVAEVDGLIPKEFLEYAKEHDPKGLYNIFVMPAGTKDRHNSDYRDGYRLLLSPDFMTADEPVVIASMSMRSKNKEFWHRRKLPEHHEWEFEQKLYSVKQQRVIHHKWTLFPQESNVEMWNKAVKRSYKILEKPYSSANCGYKHIWDEWCKANNL